MRTHRLRRLASACRLVVLLSIALSINTPAFAQSLVSGTIVDQSGQPLPRVLVVALDASGAESATTFSDEAGRFRIAVGDRCQLRVSLSGFATASAPCQAATPQRIALQVAPVRETVIVSATRTEAPADEVGASVTVFTADDLARRDTPLVGDLLRSSPGAMVVRTGAPGGVTSLFIRGGESNHTKVLLDGIPINEPGGTFNFSNVTSEGLERVEVVRGAQSALFGSDAMAGVVQLFTKRPDRSDARPHADLELEGGTYSTGRGSALVSGASGALDYALGVARLSTDNRVPNSQFQNTTLSANVGVALGPNATLRAIGRGELGRNGSPGQTAFGRPDLDAFFQRHDGLGGVTFDQQVNPMFRQRASYALSISHQQSTNLTLDPPYTPSYNGVSAPFAFSDFLYDSFNELRRHHASYQADLRLSSDGAHGDQLLTVLADWDGERAALTDRRAGTTTPASRNNEGVSIQHQATWRRVSATVGARFEHNESFGNAAVPRASVVWLAHEASGAFGDTRLRASAGLGIKEPTILQSFSPSPFFRGNPDLQPERSRSIEAGIDQRLSGDRVKFGATWFDNRYRNLIATRTTNPATFEAEYFNIGLSQARGAELSAEAAPTSAVHLRGGYTFLDSEIIDSTSPTSVLFKPGQPLFRRPRHSGFVGVAWTRDRLTVDLNGVIIGHFVDSDFSSFSPAIVENPGYTTWDLHASYRLARRISALVSVDNLANADYMEPLGYLALQRAVRVGIRVGF